MKTRRHRKVDDVQALGSVALFGDESAGQSRSGPARGFTPFEIEIDPASAA